MRRSILLSLVVPVVGALAFFSASSSPARTSPVVFGPPAVCFPFEIGDARSIPEEFTKKFTPENMVGQVVSALDASDRTLVHMETLRRAVWAMVASNRSAPMEVLASEFVSSLRWRLIEGLAGDNKLSKVEKGTLWFDLAFGQMALHQALRTSAEGGTLAMSKAMEFLPNDGAAQLGCALAMWEYDQQGEFGFYPRMLRAFEIEGDKTQASDVYLLHCLLQSGDHLVGESTRGLLLAKLKGRLVQD